MIREIYHARAVQGRRESAGKSGIAHAVRRFLKRKGWKLESRKRLG
jgi:hypothetical protein